MTLEVGQGSHHPIEAGQGPDRTLGNATLAKRARRRAQLFSHHLLEHADDHHQHTATDAATRDLGDDGADIQAAGTRRAEHSL